MAKAKATSPTVFVTVGSTKFDDLVKAITNQECIAALKEIGYSSLIVQYGKSRQAFQSSSAHLSISGYDYKQSLEDDMSSASLVISHAGSGSILESLRMKKPLVVVVNTSLMDNHQAELATELQKMNHLIVSDVSSLAETLKEKRYLKCDPFPSQDTTLFRELVDNEMGYR